MVLARIVDVGSPPEVVRSWTVISGLAPLQVSQKSATSTRVKSPVAVGVKVCAGHDVVVTGVPPNRVVIWAVTASPPEAIASFTSPGLAVVFTLVAVPAWKSA